jgi:outer-membrane receptor for ferric coprogen and ferric-rhodotorulic acid
MKRTTSTGELSRAIAMALGLSAMATAYAQVMTFNVPEQDATTAIPEFARQANLEIVAPADSLKGIRTRTIRGAIDVRAALKQLLDGTGLKIASDDGHTISLRLPAAQGASTSTTGNSNSLAAASAGDPPDDNMLQDVVVRGVALKYRPDDQTSATGLALPLIDTPQAITVLTSNMLEVVDAQSVYDATDLIPGVNRDGVGFGWERIIMRGINNAFERLNGVELDSLNYTIDGYALDRTEVVRGPATALYGVTGSFGGEINSVLKRPTKDTQIQAGFETGTWDKSIYTADVSGAIPGTGGAVTGRISDKYDGYVPEVNEPGVKNRKEMFLASLSYEFSPNTSATIWQYHADRHVDPFDGGALFLQANGKLALPPSSINPDKFYFSDPAQSNGHTQLNVSVLEFLHTFGNDWKFKSETVYSDYEQQISYFYPFGPFGAYGNPANEISIYTYDVTRHSEDLTIDESLGGDFEWLGRKQSFYAALEGVEALEPTNFTLLNSTFTGTATSSGYQSTYANGSPWVPVNRAGLGIRQTINSNIRNVKGSFQFLLRPIDRLSVLMGGLVHHGIETDVVPIASGKVLDPENIQKIQFTKFVKRIGVVYDLIDAHGAVDGVKAYVNYSEGFQPQIIEDKNGNPQSFPQNMKQYEGGLKAEFLNHAVGSSLAVYEYNITNVPAGDTPIGSFGAFGTTVADGNQKAIGVEAELTGEILPGWNLSTNYAYSDIYVSNPEYAYTSPVANVPKHKGAIYSSYEFVEGPLKSLRLGGGVVVSSGYPLVQGLVNVAHWGQIDADGYTRVDLSASYKGFGTFAESLKGLELYGNIHNLFNQRILYSKEGTPEFAIQYSDLRAFNIGLRYKF